MAESAAGGLLDSAHPVAALSYIFLIVHSLSILHFFDTKQVFIFSASGTR